MSQQDLWIVIGRAKTDDEFSGRLFKNFPQALAEQSYQLDDNEIRTAQMVLSNSRTNSFPQAMLDSFAFENKMKQERMIKQAERLHEMGTYTIQILKDTLSNAASTYKTITRMNIVMFIVGIGLFLFAAFYAVFSEEKVYSLIFGGLGTVT